MPITPALRLHSIYPLFSPRRAQGYSKRQGTHNSFKTSCMDGLEALESPQGQLSPLSSFFSQDRCIHLWYLLILPHLPSTNHTPIHSHFSWRECQSVSLGPLPTEHPFQVRAVRALSSGGVDYDFLLVSSYRRVYISGVYPGGCFLLFQYIVIPAELFFCVSLLLFASSTRSHCYRQ